ncbi:hypothetical protein BH721_00930 [Clostridium baratii]|uniref:hypothetical protein n=1 Tax=Clostridium baratii TaxID=1561 RepID=UPI0009A42041|nr:hypothetical protein [Clostridium baratii]OPF51624.1 hypothetical protein A1M12_03545 [Clostridium baratii]OPF55304.1 hypothetical protein BH721_00930 [Clostridium baratii]OPF57587.1 hypothetical protein BH724_08185 [Clostridium baratii]OPF60315.1 hypothetical protein BH725_06995 [Clostridium baratii]
MKIIIKSVTKEGDSIIIKIESTIEQRLYAYKKFNRVIKNFINPLYGKKCMGWINDPKRATYNKTTVSAK